MSCESSGAAGETARCTRRNLAFAPRMPSSVREPGSLRGEEGKGAPVDASSERFRPPPRITGGAEHPGGYPGAVAPPAARPL